MTKPLSKLDKEAAKLLAATMGELLKPLATTLGVEVVFRGGTFDPSLGTYKPRIEVRLKSVGGKEQGAVAFEAFLPFGWGLTKDDYGVTFKYAGESFTISGAVARGKRNILATRNRDGRVFKFAAGDIARLMGRTPERMPVHVERGDR